MGFGLILFQKQVDDSFHLAVYYSKRRTEVESEYHNQLFKILTD